jgi:hypothetical protein
LVTSRNPLSTRPRSSAKRAAVGGGDEVLARDEQDVRRRLGRDVGKGHHQIVLMEEVRGFPTRDDAAEQAVSVGRQLRHFAMVQVRLHSTEERLAARIWAT